MSNNTIENTSAGNTSGSSNSGLRWSHVVWIILATILLTAGATYWVVRSYIYAKDFKPVVLKDKEVVVLNKKLEQLGFSPQSSTPDVPANQSAQNAEYDADGNLVPEPYSEVGAKREVSFTERELNSLLANNTELAKKLAIDLSSNLMSAKLLVPMDQDFPILGGKTLRVTSGLEVAYENNQPIVILRGVSIMGIPIPNAWLGGIKNIDLVKEFGTSEGFWKAFAEGVESINVEDGQLKIKLKE